jgi:hypothetical protein
MSSSIISGGTVPAVSNAGDTRVERPAEVAAPVRRQFLVRGSAEHQGVDPVDLLVGLTC